MRDAIRDGWNSWVTGISLLLGGVGVFVCAMYVALTGGAY